ncbi:MAG: prepilin-type N-terminal cleavage/methylation domain-containing protein [Candidatus Omnitrophica bacterium]|nr:prepilin-type N-terminal cleavage/methylation domain-containing protein [Candidatus Omnitrophota bacterium]MBU1923055.1 prepilin-type N-terminal cleavage/methylation domain-containing protein [Candidatus Omnitrophota bacterium]
MPKRNYGLSLIELLVSMILMSLVLLGIFSIDLFSRHHVITSDKRAKVQNEISYAIEYMSKYVQQGIGDYNSPPITIYPTSGSQTGFRVRVDLNNPKTARDLTDDTWVNFYLDGNALKTTGVITETLTERIVGVFVTDIMPEFPAGGFYVKITDQGAAQGMAVDIGLVGRYDPAAAASLDNPQVAMKTRLVSPSSSAQ